MCPLGELVLVPADSGEGSAACEGNHGQRRCDGGSFSNQNIF